MTESDLDVERDRRGVVALTLRRPERRNALDGPLTEQLIAVLQRLSGDRNTRVVTLTGTGTAFCAGADLDWLDPAADGDSEARARTFAELFQTLDRLPQPVVARVNGDARGGGLGLIACADVAVASREATFAFSEVRVGLAPVVIAPYVQATIGLSAMRRYFLTGEVFDASRARALQLVHEVCAEDELDDVSQLLEDGLLAGAPEAQAAVKTLILRLQAAGPNTYSALTAPVLGRLLDAREAREGIAAFREDRRPDWAD